MNEIMQKRIASVVVALTGLWVALSPLFIDMSTTAMWNAIAAGSLLAIMGLGQLYFRSATPSVLGVLLAMWLASSAFLIDHTAAAVWSLLAASAVGFLVSLWDIVAVQDLSQHRVSHSM
jgi:hypothetical protein